MFTEHNFAAIALSNGIRLTTRQKYLLLFLKQRRRYRYLSNRMSERHDPRNFLQMILMILKFRIQRNFSTVIALNTITQDCDCKMLDIPIKNIFITKN